MPKLYRNILLICDVVVFPANSQQEPVAVISLEDEENVQLVRQKRQWGGGHRGQGGFGGGNFGGGGFG